MQVHYFHILLGCLFSVRIGNSLVQGMGWRRWHASLRDGTFWGTDWGQLDAGTGSRWGSCHSSRRAHITLWDVRVGPVASQAVLERLPAVFSQKLLYWDAVVVGSEFELLVSVTRIPPLAILVQIQTRGQCPLPASLALVGCSQSGPH